MTATPSEPAGGKARPTQLPHRSFEHVGAKSLRHLPVARTQTQRRLHQRQRDGALFGCASENRTNFPQGEFARIDVTQLNHITAALERGDVIAVQQVLDNPGSYAPPVLYALSEALYNAGQKDEAMEYFYLGQLRARSDADKCLDPTAGAAVSVLNDRYGRRINQYAFRDVSKLRQTVNGVIVLDRELPRAYDPRWIALHGMDAFSRTKVRFAPQAQWNEINEACRKQYLESFNEALRAYGIKE